MPLLAIRAWQPSVEPFFLAAAAIVGVGYLRSAAPALASSDRRAVLLSGIVLIVVAFGSPIETIAAHYLLLFHLLQNVMISDWAPPLLILGLTPAMRAALAARMPPFVRSLTRPVCALAVWLTGWYTIHLAALYDFALTQTWALNVEHGLLIAIGLVFWWPVLSDPPHQLSTLARLGYLGRLSSARASSGLP